MIKSRALVVLAAILAVSAVPVFAQDGYIPLEEAEAQQEAELIKKAEEAAKKAEESAKKPEESAKKPEAPVKQEVQPAAAPEAAPVPAPAPAPVPAAAPKAKNPAAAAAPSKPASPAAIVQSEWVYLMVKGADKDEDVLEIVLPQVEDWLARNPEHAGAGEAQLLKANLHYKLGDYKAAIMDLLRHFYEYPQGESSAAANKLFQELVDKKADKKLKPGLLGMAGTVESGDAGVRLYSMLRKAPAQAGAFLYAPIIAEHRAFLNRFPVRPDNDVLRLSLAEIYLNMKEYLQASLAYEKLIELHPASPLIPKAKLFLGVVFADNLKAYDKAIAVFQDIVTAFPGTEQAWAAYGRLPALAEKQEKYPLAVEVYEKIITLYPDKPESYEAFRSEARVLREELAKPAEAAAVLSRLADKYTGERAIEALFLAAEIARKDLKDPAREIKTYDRIVAEYPADPQAPKALFAAAEVYENEKNLDKTREYYAKVIEKYADNALAKKAQKRLDALSGK